MWEHSAFLTSALDESECLALHPSIFTLGGRIPAMYWSRGLVGRKIDLEVIEEKCLLPMRSTNPNSSAVHSLSSHLTVCRLLDGKASVQNIDTYVRVHRS
jgi:hypothetical protein